MQVRYTLKKPLKNNYNYTNLKKKKYFCTLIKTD